MQSSSVLMFLLLINIYTQTDGAATRRYNLAGQPRPRLNMMSELDFLVQQAETLMENRMQDMSTGMNERDKTSMQNEIGEIRQMADAIPGPDDDEMEGATAQPEYNPILRNTFKKITAITTNIDQAIQTLPTAREIVGIEGDPGVTINKFKRWVHKARSFVHRAVGEPGSEQRQDVKAAVKAVATLSFRIANLFQL